MDRKLIDYLPEVLKDIREFELIMSSEQQEIENLWKNLNRYVDNSFIISQDEKTVEKWEKLLDIRAKDNDSLELRNLRISSIFNEQIPYTVRSFRRMLTALVGNEREFKLSISRDRVDVKLALGSRELVKEVDKLLDRIVPLNMFISLGLLYASYKGLKRFTHKELKGHTYLGIRNLDLREE